MVFYHYSCSMVGLKLMLLQVLCMPFTYGYVCYCRCKKNDRWFKKSDEKFWIQSWIYRRFAENEWCKYLFSVVVLFFFFIKIFSYWKNSYNHGTKYLKFQVPSRHLVLGCTIALILIFWEFKLLMFFFCLFKKLGCRWYCWHKRRN